MAEPPRAARERGEGKGRGAASGGRAAPAAASEPVPAGSRSAPHASPLALRPSSASSRRASAWTSSSSTWPPRLAQACTRGVLRLGVVFGACACRRPRIRHPSQWIPRGGVADPISSGGGRRARPAGGSAKPWRSPSAGQAGVRAALVTQGSGATSADLGPTWIRSSSAIRRRRRRPMRRPSRPGSGHPRHPGQPGRRM